MNYYKAKTEEDFKFIASLFREDNTQYMLSKKLDYKSLMKADKSKQKYNFIVIIDNRKIAWFNLFQSMNGNMVNFGMIVDKDYQGQGYGQKIMKIVEQEAKKLGVNKIRLGVFEDNKAAVHIYKKAGFKETGYLINMEKEI